MDGRLNGELRIMNRADAPGKHPVWFPTTSLGAHQARSAVVLRRSMKEFNGKAVSKCHGRMNCRLELATAGYST